MRFLMTISYDGSFYNGYQKQPKVKTVQAEIEKSLKTLANKKIEIHASGRTDAKVHAINQKAHFDFDTKMNESNIMRALNSLLPDNIYIKNIEKVSDTFHARYNVKAKEYIYKINMGEYDPIEKNYIYQYNKKLDFVEMQRALKFLEGTHNFKSFTKASDVKEDYCRTIVNTNIIRDLKTVNKITISFLGTGFMRYMVRNIVGTLIEIGEGKRKSEEIIDILKAENRTKAGRTANPEGLYLKDVFY